MKYTAVNQRSIKPGLIVFAPVSSIDLWPGIISICSYGIWKGFWRKPDSEQVYVEFFDDYTGAWVNREELKKFEYNPEYANEKYEYAFLEARDYKNNCKRNSQITHLKASDLYEGALVLVKYRNFPPWPARVQASSVSGTWIRTGRLRSSTAIHVSYIDNTHQRWIPLADVCLYTPGETFGRRVLLGTILWTAHVYAMESIKFLWKEENLTSY